MRNILVTGGAGFIGSNFVHILLNMNDECSIVNLDALTYAGNLENLADIKSSSRHTFVKGDIRDRNLLCELFERYSIDTVVNFAAESHVDRSIDNPELFLTTNIIGTQALLDVSMAQWRTDGSGSVNHGRSYRPGVRFVQISTDEVYGTLGDSGLFTEESPIAPNSPYSASKAAADLIVRAYCETFGLPANITRCSNNYGPYQFPEKLIPLMINNCMHDKPLPIYGDGLQTRDWLHVSDHCEAIIRVLERGESGKVYNIGGRCEKTNMEMALTILRAFRDSKSEIVHVKDRPGHDRRYAIDNSRIVRELGWEPRYTLEAGIAETIFWYRKNRKWLQTVTSGEYKDFYIKQYGSFGG